MPARWRNIKSLSVASAIAVAAVAFTGSNVLADDPNGPPPAFMMHWDASNDQLPTLVYDPVDFGTVEWGNWTLGGGPNGQGGPLRERTGWRYLGGNSNPLWTLEWDCVVNADPFVDATINVTNNSLSTQTFWVYMPLPIMPSIPGGTLMDGFVSAVVSDQNFDGAMLGANDSPVYRAYIDNAQVGGSTNMWNPGYMLMAPGAGGINNDDESFSNLIGPAAMSEIAVWLRFDLSPGDSASVTGVFEVNPIPAPAALSLLGLAGLLGHRRRRA